MHTEGRVRYRYTTDAPGGNPWQDIHMLIFSELRTNTETTPQVAQPSEQAPGKRKLKQIY